MTIIYFDILTTLLFFSFVFYVERKGIMAGRSNNPNFQKLNTLFFRNQWLYVLPYFYSITFLTDLETFLSLKSKAIQLVYFFVLMIIQVLIFLKIQPQSVFSYGWAVKENLQKIQNRFSKKPPKDGTDEDFEAILVQRRSVSINLQEVLFLLNSFILPILFIVTNSFYFTKIIAYFF